MQRSAITSLSLASLVSMMLMPSVSSAQGVGDIYWGLFGGAEFYEDNEIGNDDDVEFDPGFNFGGNIGYIFGSVRAEAEIGYSESDLDGRGSSGSLDILRGTGGLYFDFVGASQSNILPYVGGGFGFAGVDVDSSSDTALTAHGEAGVSFAASANFDVYFAYRFLWYDVDDLSDDLVGHQARVGIRFFPGGASF